MNLLIPFPTAPPSPLGNAFLAFSETFSRSKLANQAACDAMFRTNERATVLVLEAFVYHVCRANRQTLVSLVSAVTNHYAVILCCPLLHLTQWSVCRRFFFAFFLFYVKPAISCCLSLSFPTSYASEHSRRDFAESGGCYKHFRTNNQIHSVENWILFLFYSVEIFVASLKSGCMSIPSGAPTKIKYAKPLRYRSEVYMLCCSPSCGAAVVERNFRHRQPRFVAYGMNLKWLTKCVKIAWTDACFEHCVCVISSFCTRKFVLEDKHEFYPNNTIDVRAASRCNQFFLSLSTFGPKSRFSWANVNIAAFFKFDPVRLPLLVYPKVQCYLL